MNSKNLYFNLEQQRSKYWRENSIKTGQSPKKNSARKVIKRHVLEESNDPFRCKKREKSRKRGSDTSRANLSLSNRGSIAPPKNSQVLPPHLPLLKKVAVELVITISLPDVGCLSICQFAGSRWNQGGRKVKNWTIGCPVPSSAVYYGSTEQGSFIHHIGEGSHGLRVCSH